MPWTLADGVRASAVTKLKIDARIQPRNPNGRNLLVRIPQHCRTVRDFKNYILQVYLNTSSTINLFVDQFWIPDEEDSCIFTLLSDPIRVVPSLTELMSSVSPRSAASTSRQSTPSISPLAIQRWREPERIPSSVESLRQNGVDDVDLSRVSSRSDVQISPFKIFKEPQIPSDSEKRLTSSAKRRNRLRRAVELAAGAPQSRTTDSGIFDVTLTPENASEQQPAITPISRKNAKGKLNQSVKTENSYSDSLEESEKKDKVHPFTHPRATGTKRKVTMMPESFGSPPLKMERIASRMEKRPDTPRVPKSLKNPRALEVFNSFEFSSGKGYPEKKTGGDNALAYLQGKGRKFVEHLKDIPQTTSFGDSIPSSSLAHNGSSENLNSTSDEKYIPKKIKNFPLAEAETGAAGPLDPDYYSSLPDLGSVDDISENSIIAFKLLEIGENYEPRTSEYKEALVVGKSGYELKLEYLKSNSIKTSGKFEIEGFESGEQDNPVDFIRMIEPKLVRSSSTEGSTTE